MKLTFKHMVVGSFFGNQFRMCSLFDDLALFEHIHHIGFFYGCNTVTYDYQCFVGKREKVIKYTRLGKRVYRTVGSSSTTNGLSR